MARLEKILSPLYQGLLSERTKEKSERVIVSIAILTFLLHLLVIFLVDFNIIRLEDPGKLLTNPIAAIYTPFSFILIYEVYLLVYYLPNSITVYIGKQYEIITLILIRRIFKDLANLDLSSNWFEDKYDLQFTYDIIATILLFFLIYLFYRLNPKKTGQQKKPLSERVKKFIRRKKYIAGLLVPVLLFVAIYSLFHWAYENYQSIGQIVSEVKDVNNVFFDQFFTVLILTDVLLLLLSLYHTDKFSKVIRNSGFIISTILIRLSFGVDGLMNTALIVVAVLFGVIILYIHNRYENIKIPKPVASTKEPI